MRKTLIAFLVALCGYCAMLPALADIQTISANGSLTAAGPTQTLNFGGQANCSVVVSPTSTATGYALVPQASSDYGATWATAATVGGGSISSTGTYTGNVAAVGLTNFRANLSSIASGTLNYVITCSPATSTNVTVAGPISVNTAPPYVKIQDGVSATNASVGAPNGSTFGAGTANTLGVNVFGTSVYPVASQGWTNGDAAGNQLALATYGIGYGYNGTTFDKYRTTQGINSVAITGLAATGICNAATSTPNCVGVYNNYQNAVNFGYASLGINGNLSIYNGTTSDLMKSTQAFATGQTGLLATGICGSATSQSCAFVDTTPNVNFPGRYDLDTNAFVLGYNGSTYDMFKTTQAFQGSAVGIEAIDLCSTSATSYCQNIDVTKHAYVTSGGGAAVHLTSASPTACTSSSTLAGNRLIGITNSSLTPQTATLTLYDEGASPTCALADQVYQVVLGASQIVAFPNGGILLTNGLAETLSATLTNPIVIQRAQ